MGELERGVRLAMEMSIPDILLLAMADKTYILHTATSVGRGRLSALERARLAPGLGCLMCTRG